MDEIFADIEWSSDIVFGQSVSRLKEAGESFRVLDPWYDVDSPESLRFLASHVCALAESKSSNLPHATHQVIRNLRMNGNEKE